MPPVAQDTLHPPRVNMVYHHTNVARDLHIADGFHTFEIDAHDLRGDEPTGILTKCLDTKGPEKGAHFHLATGTWVGQPHRGVNGLVLCVILRILFAACARGEHGDPWVRLRFQYSLCRESRAMRRARCRGLADHDMGTAVPEDIGHGSKKKTLQWARGARPVSVSSAHCTASWRWARGGEGQREREGQGRARVDR